MAVLGQEEKENEVQAVVKLESKMDIDKWIEIAKDCKYLPENDLKVNIENSLISEIDVLVGSGNVIQMNGVQV